MYNRLSLHPVWCRVQVTLLIIFLNGCTINLLLKHKLFPRSVGSKPFAWATLVLSNVNQKLGDVSTAISCVLDNSAYVPNNTQVHDYS